MDIIQKLRVKNGVPLWLLNVPKELESIFSGCAVKTKVTAKDEIMQAVLFASSQAILDASFKSVVDRLSDDALVWIAYPKKSGAIKSDIDRDKGWDVVHAAGYDGVTQVAVDKDWSALRFKKSSAIKDKIRDVPMEERQTDGIDYANRTTVLPADARTVLQKYEGLESFFNSMAFSHRKEHLVAIADAKKPETRQRRIERMVEMLLKMKQQKNK